MNRNPFSDDLFYVFAGYSGLTKSGQGEVTPYWFKVKPL
ncbi:hypothetical protein HMPREF1051_0961 [Neisseria sicca VK64]|uniref:Uncharacterized protein n=1 Tax=Neisseria sicca VK64 TaxID=1095748 RepID=I2NUK7_NEISI|nr:hypothetical protein HMPREF1051_0961 [Neisseria sicca VK64]